MFAILLTIWTDLPSKSWQDFEPKKVLFEWPKCKSHIPSPDSTMCCSQDTDSTFSLVETFAGQAEVTKAFRRSYLRSVRLDLEYMSPRDGHQNPMDLLSDSGFVTLGNDS